MKNLRSFLLFILIDGGIRNNFAHRKRILITQFVPVTFAQCGNKIVRRNLPKPQELPKLM